jgi:hypothetical protein
VAVEREKMLPHLSELYEEIIKAFGGPKEVAQEVHRVYHEAPQGSQVRARMVESILRGVETLHHEGMLDNEKEPSAMNEQELKKFLERMVEKKVRSLKLHEHVREFSTGAEPSGDPED